MKTVEITTDVTHYNMAVEPVENAAGGKNYPRLCYEDVGQTPPGNAEARKSDGKHPLPPQTVTGDGIKLEPEDIDPKAMDLICKKWKLIPEDVCARFSFGFNNKEQGVLRASVPNPTKPAGIKEMTKAVGKWALKNEDYDLAQRLFEGSVGKEELGKLYQENCK